MKILITGATGFVAPYLISALKQQHKLFTLSRSDLKTNSHFKCDLLDFNRVSEILQEIKPDILFHLGAISDVAYSFKEPIQTYEVNLKSSIYLVNTLANTCPNSTFINISSGDVYGDLFLHSDIASECDNALPNNPYACSKLAFDNYLRYFNKCSNLKILSLRPFNHYGPKQRENFVISSFAQQIANIQNNTSTIKVGNLEVFRNFTYISDIIYAYKLCIENIENFPKYGIFNICSDTPIQISEILNILIEISNKKVIVVQDKNRLRPSDIKFVNGTAEKFKKLTNWSSKVSLKEGLNLLYQSINN